MSRPSYDGAGWRRRVIGMAKADLSPDRKLVLLALETFADYRDGANAHPGERVLADMCKLTTRAVRDALACGRDLRLIDRTHIANPKRGKSDVYRMLTTGTAVPVETATTGTAVPVNNGHHRNRHDITTGTATTSPPEPPFRPPTQVPTQVPREESPKPGTSPAVGAPGPNDPDPNRSAIGKPATAEPAPPDPFDCDDDPPKDHPGPFDDTAAATAAPPTPDELERAADLPPHPGDRPAFTEPEPSPFCPKVPGGCPGRCGDCGEARKRHEAWDGRRRAFNADLAAAKRLWVQRCRECDDEHGHKLDAHGLVTDVAEKCSHDRLRTAAYAARHGAFTTPSRREAS